MTGSGKSGFTLLPDKNSLSGVDRAPEQDYNPFVVICIAGLAAHSSFIFLFFFIGANHLVAHTEAAGHDRLTPARRGRAVRGVREAAHTCAPPSRTADRSDAPAATVRR